MVLFTGGPSQLGSLTPLGRVAAGHLPSVGLLGGRRTQGLQASLSVLQTTYASAQTPRVTRQFAVRSRQAGVGPLLARSAPGLHQTRARALPAPCPPAGSHRLPISTNGE